MEQRVKALLDALERGDQTISAKASADLAGLIWQGSVDDEVIKWLSLGSPKLRSTVAWAVWDAASPFSALTYLINESINDPNDSVRLYSLKALIQYQGDRIMRRSGIEKFLHDSCDTIREHATSVLKELDPDSE